MGELEAHMGFSHCLGIGPITFNTLVQAFGSAEEAYRANRKDLMETIGAKTAEKFLLFRHEFDPKKKLEELKKKDIQVVVKSTAYYPSSLLSIPDPPICLYIRGDLQKFQVNDNRCFGIVGTRKSTEYGEYVARMFSSGLAACGFTIVSGMAFGIDAVSHRTCIELRKPTIAVLGCGVDIVYPYANKDIYDNIVEGNGLVISEFPPGMTVQKGLFIARNRLISGLSKGILVVEGEKDSGSLVTARYAAEQGKDVFCPPVPINSSLSQAPNILLKQGAKLVTAVEDILEEYNIKHITDNIRKETVPLEGMEKEIYILLEKKSLSADELSLILNQSNNKVMQNLSVLEVRQLIVLNNKGKYEVHR